MPQHRVIRLAKSLHHRWSQNFRSDVLAGWPKTVRYRRERWRQAADGQSAAERLFDLPRSGAPATYTAEQIWAIVPTTCEKPSESERPINQWSQREIADEAVRRGIVDDIHSARWGVFSEHSPDRALAYRLRYLGVCPKTLCGLQSFLSMRRIEARRKKARPLRLRFSQSLASLRQRLSHAIVRSTIQRLGR